MVFNSYTFLLFFAIVLSVYYLPLSWKFKKAHLLVSSYLFYATWNPPFVGLLLISTIVDWFAARWMFQSQNRAHRRLLLIVSLATNLGLLGFFKYANFVLQSFTDMLSSVGIIYVPPQYDIILPVGISFYTFQTLSYTIDVYRRRLAPADSPLDFALYVTFFPQLVAGPIVRASEFLPQCITPKRASGRQFGWGLSLLTLGLFEKVVVADWFLADVVEKVYDASLPVVGCLDAWVGTLAFAGQIFCDFAGYSTCAIGVAMCFGFALPDNFRYPYAAIGFSDFWRRWHISLSSWLRDYLYIPLGGNRSGKVRTYVNLMTTMLLGGLWHGASWTFVIWGAIHGVYLVIERGLGKLPIARLSVWNTQWGRSFLIVLTFVLVCFTWVFFRASSFAQAFALVASMLGASERSPPLLGRSDLMRALVPVGLIFAVHCYMRDRTLEDFAAKLPSWSLAAGLGVMLFAIFAVPGEDRAFIYFQF